MEWKSLGGIAVFGAIAAAWTQVKSFLNGLRNLIVVTHHIEYWGFRDAIMRWMNTNLTFVNIGARSYVVRTLDGVDRMRVPVAAWNRMLGSHLAIYKGKIPVFINVGTTFDDVSITYIKGTFPIDLLCKELVGLQEDDIRREYRSDTDGTWTGSGFWMAHIWGSLSAPLNYNSQPDKPVGNAQRTSAPEIAVPSGSSGVASELSRLTLKNKVFVTVAGDTRAIIELESNTQCNTKRDKDKWLTRMYLEPHQKQVIDEIKFWMSSRDWYKQRGISWRRSMLLYGDPGTGKSTLAYALGTALDIPIRIFHMDTMTDKDFVNEWRSHWGTAMIHLLEDFDTVFEGRENKFRNDMNNALSFECLLNVLDGVETSDGIITIVTTNNPDVIDTALLRPGRVDTKVAFGPLDIIGKLHIGKSILPHMSEKELTNLFEKVHPNNATGAVIQELCIKEALRQHWRDFKN